MNLEERRAWLEKEAGQKIPGILWKELVRGRHAKAGEMDEDQEELLLEQTRFGLLMRQRNKSDTGRSHGKFSPVSGFSWRAKSPDLRREVFAKCVANVAEDHPGVRAFREEVLGDSFPLTYDQALHYVNEDGHVREGAPHAQKLEDLTETLASTFLWAAPDASWFVLCAYYTPPVLTFGIESSVKRYGSGPEIGTITLTVEPWVPPETVKEMYKKAQRQMLGKRTHQVSKNRLRLLELVETMGEGLSWQDRMNLWNEFHSRQYKDRGNFSKAYREIRESVLEPGYSIPDRDEKTAREDRRNRIKRNLKTVERELRILRRVERAERIAREVTGEVS